MQFRRRYYPHGGRGALLLVQGSGILVVLFSGVNQGFWSHLGVSGRNATPFSRQGISVLGLFTIREKLINAVILVLRWYLLGAKI